MHAEAILSNSTRKLSRFVLKFHSPVSPDPLNARSLRSLGFPKSPPPLKKILDTPIDDRTHDSCRRIRFRCGCCRRWSFVLHSVHSRGYVAARCPSVCSPVCPVDRQQKHRLPEGLLLSARHASGKYRSIAADAVELAAPALSSKCARRHVDKDGAG